MYASAVAPFLPGIGSGAAAALSAGGALSQGKDITAGMMASARSAVPGGTVSKSAFVFMNPLYFLLIMLGDARTRPMVMSLAGGAIFGPLIHLLAPQWSVLAGGLIGGSVAFALHRVALRNG